MQNCLFNIVFLLKTYLMFGIVSPVHVSVTLHIQFVVCFCLDMFVKLKIFVSLTVDILPDRLVAPLVNFLTFSF